MLENKGFPSLPSSSLRLFNVCFGSQSSSTAIRLPSVVFTSSSHESSITIIFGWGSTSAVVGLSRVMCRKGLFILSPNSSIMDACPVIFMLTPLISKRITTVVSLVPSMLIVQISTREIFNTLCFKGRMRFCRLKRATNALFKYSCSESVACIA